MNITGLQKRLKQSGVILSRKNIVLKVQEYVFKDENLNETSDFDLTDEQYKHFVDMLQAEKSEMEKEKTSELVKQEVKEVENKGQLARSNGSKLGTVKAIKKTDASAEIQRIDEMLTEDRAVATTETSEALDNFIDEQATAVVLGKQEIDERFRSKLAAKIEENREVDQQRQQQTEAVVLKYMVSGVIDVGALF